MKALFNNFSKRAIVPGILGLCIPVAVAFASSSANSFYNSSTVNAKSATFACSSATKSNNMIGNVLSSASASKATLSFQIQSASSHIIESSKGSDIVTDDVNEIQQATTDGIDKINSATSQAIDKINNIPTKSSPYTSSKLSEEEIKQRTYYELPSPYDSWKGLDPQTDAYNAAIKTFNDYAASVGIPQDALHTEVCKSQAITRWFKDHPQYHPSQPPKIAESPQN